MPVKVILCDLNGDIPRDAQGNVMVSLVDRLQQKLVMDGQVYERMDVTEDGTVTYRRLPY